MYSFAAVLAVSFLFFSLFHSFPAQRSVTAKYNLSIEVIHEGKENETARMNRHCSNESNCLFSDHNRLDLMNFVFQ